MKKEGEVSLRVFISTIKFKGGPATFRGRLIASLNKIKDIKVINDEKEKFDIGIEFIRKNSKYSQPYILRASSCYYLYKYKIYNNKPIFKSIKKSVHTIFQSNFAYKLCNKVLSLEDRGAISSGYSIIYNGVDIDYINGIKPKEGIIPGSFVACARWDSNKRPVSMIKGFLEADTKRHLYIIGGEGVNIWGRELGKKYRKNKYIHFLGEKSNKKTISIMKACDYQIHLAFVDICPNVVLEGLACGLNVLCCNLGGTSEIVGKNGVILNTDKYWKSKYLRYTDDRSHTKRKHLDEVNSTVVAKGIHKLLKNKVKPNMSKFNIDDVAKKYADIIRKSI
jgi:glycosyltransferase involved in cell wall biosynthesis